MKHILVCDDEPNVLVGLCHLLRSADREIETAVDGADALEKIKTRLPDLLITDVMMPRMNGLELVAALRADPRTRELPVILVTARGELRGAQTAENSSGASIVAKPFDPRTLRQLVSDKFAPASRAPAPQPSAT